MKTIKILSLCSIAVLLAGCASTTIYPKEDNTFSLVTTSSDQGAAEKDAKEKAQKYCNNLGKQLAVIKHDTVYKGADKNNVAVIGLVGAVLGAGGGHGRSNEDYELKMHFKCV